MKFIELHIHSQPLLLNISLIESIKPSCHIGQATVYMAGSDADTYWLTDESYEEILNMLQGRA